jgi:hypothetical protein
MGPGVAERDLLGGGNPGRIRVELSLRLLPGASASSGLAAQGTAVRNTVEREIIVRELLDEVTNYANLRPQFGRHFSVLRLSARILP